MTKKNTIAVADTIVTAHLLRSRIKSLFVGCNKCFFLYEYLFSLTYLSSCSFSVTLSAFSSMVWSDSDSALIFSKPKSLKMLAMAALSA